MRTNIVFGLAMNRAAARTARDIVVSAGPLTGWHRSVALSEAEPAQARGCDDVPYLEMTIMSVGSAGVAAGAGRSPRPVLRAVRSRLPLDALPRRGQIDDRVIIPGWALVSAAAAPVALVGGWSLAAQRQPDGFDSTVDTISALAATGATDRWLMTAALIAVGVCHVVTALGLSPAAVAGRITLGLGGVATMLVAAFPLPAVGDAPAHAAAAGVAFVALAAWPALAWRRDPAALRPTALQPAALRPAVSIGAALVLLVLVGWFAVTLGAGGRVGLAERVAAGAQACWPLLVALSARRAATTRPR